MAHPLISGRSVCVYVCVCVCVGGVKAFCSACDPSASPAPSLAQCVRRQFSPDPPRGSGGPSRGHFVKDQHRKSNGATGRARASERRDQGLLCDDTIVHRSTVRPVRGTRQCFCPVCAPVSALLLLSPPSIAPKCRDLRFAGSPPGAELSDTSERAEEPGRRFDGASWAGQGRARPDVDFFAVSHRSTYISLARQHRCHQVRKKHTPVLHVRTLSSRPQSPVV